MSVDRREIDQALANGEFRPHFQPLISLRTGQLHGFELLARWKHPQRGWISPDEFVPLAEKDGWIDQLTMRLLRAGFSTMAAVPASVSLSVNISPVQLRGVALPGGIREIAAQTGFDLSRLTIEITESALADNLEQARGILSELKSSGVRLALDDFGTGYSSLTQLQVLPFDELKVDHSFVRSMADLRHSRKIVAAVVGLGQSLGLTTVAEGVETLEQVQILQWLGCEFAQGWFYGKAMPADEIAAAVLKFQHVTRSSVSIDTAGQVPSGIMDVLPATRLAQLQALYDGAPVGLAFLDRDLRYKMLNHRLASMNGRPMEEHLGKTVGEMIPDTFPTLQTYLRRALQGEAVQGIEITMPSQDAKGVGTLLLSYEPARDEAGEVIGVSVAIVDVSAVKRAEQARRESEEHFRHMIELLPQIPWIMDPEGRALDVSQRWLEISGTKQDRWKGYGWLDALHPEDLQPTWVALRRSFESRNPIDIVYRVRPSETAQWKRLRSRGAARIGADGEIICWYGCLEETE